MIVFIDWAYDLLTRGQGYMQGQSPPTNRTTGDIMLPPTPLLKTSTAVMVRFLHLLKKALIFALAWWCGCSSETGFLQVAFSDQVHHTGLPGDNANPGDTFGLGTVTMLFRTN